MNTYTHKRRFFGRFPGGAELIIWLLAVVLLYSMDPASNTFSLCFFKWVGIDFCPGCGLAHSIHDILHGAFYSGFKHHPLGFFALGMILFRIFQLFLFIKPKQHAKQ